MRVLVVGLGIQGRKRKAVAGDEVAATVDPVNPEADYPSVEQVAAEAFDAALVCVSDDVKLALVERFLALGKHVLVEKPLLAAEPAQLERLKELAHTRGVACYTAYNHRFEPHIARLHNVLETGQLGQIYLVRVFYGNGTALDVKRSPWRDRGLGVVTDIGSHLLDMLLFLFGPAHRKVELWSLDCFENRACDHVVFGCPGPPVVVLEATLVSWLNTFSVDVYGEQGSAHIAGLCKWGPSTLTVRRRVFPSGRPQEHAETLPEGDPTWRLEYDHFKRLCTSGATNIGNDVWINGVLSELAAAAGIPLT